MGNKRLNILNRTEVIIPRILAVFNFCVNVICGSVFVRYLKFDVRHIP
jgi:hypothetical protein